MANPADQLLGPEGVAARREELLAAALRKGSSLASRLAGLVSPQADTAPAAAVAGLRSLLPGHGSYREELDRYNEAAAPSPFFSPDQRYTGSVVAAPEPDARHVLDLESPGTARALDLGGMFAGSTKKGKGGGKGPPPSDIQLLSPEDYLARARERFGEGKLTTLSLDEVTPNHDVPNLDPARTAAHVQAYREGRGQPVVFYRTSTGRAIPLDGNRRATLAAPEAGLSQVPGYEVPGPPANAPRKGPPDITQMTPDEALATAVRGEHLKQKKSGQYVGAPEGTTTMAQIEALRKRSDQAVEQGIEGGPWYLQDRDLVRELAPNDPIRQRQLARGLSIYSQEASPQQALDRLFTQVNAHQMEGAAAGEATKPYYPEQAEATRATFEAGDLSPLSGPKTGAMYEAMDPTRDYESLTRTVNDRRRARAQGFGDAGAGGLKIPQHRYMWFEGQLQAQRLAELLRARPDLAERLHAEYPGNVPPNVATTQAAEWSGEPVLAAMEKAAQEGRTLTPAEVEEIKQQGRASHTTAAPGNTAYGLGERIAGAKTGHMTGEVGMPYNVKQQITALRSAASRTGTDVVVDALGGVQRRMLPDRGDFAGPAGAETNPLEVSRTMIGRKGGTIDPASRKMMDTATLFEAVMTGQNAQGWFALKPATEKAATGWRASFGKPLPATKINALRTDLQKQGYVIHALGGGDYIVTTGDYASTKPGLPKPQIAGAALQPGIVESGYVDLAKGWRKPQGSAVQTRQLMNALRKQPLAGAALSDAEVRRWLERLNQRDPGIATTHGLGPPRADLVKLRDVWARDGMQGVLDLVKKNKGKYSGLGLPAALLAPQLSEEQQSSE